MYVKQVSSNLYRGSRPETEDDFKQLRDLGMLQILCLESGLFELLTLDFNGEMRMATDNKMYLTHVQMSPISPPDKDEIDIALSVIRGATKNIFVHCKDGVDRTGVVCAVYRILADGWSADTAMKEMLDMGFHRFRFFYWLPKIKKILSDYCQHITL